MIIDGKFEKKRIAVSVDDLLAAIYGASLDEDETVRRSVKRLIREGDIKNSEDTRRFMLTEISKPALLKKIQDSDGYYMI